MSGVVPCKRKNASVHTVRINKVLCIAPDRSTWRRLRLCVRIEEHCIRRDALLPQLLSNLFRLGQEVARYMLDSRTLFRSQEVHHLLRRRPSRSRPHFGPTLRTLEEDTHGMKAGDAICASHYCCEIFEIRREGGEIVVNALRLDRQAF